MDTTRIIIAKSGKGYVKITDMALARHLVCMCGGRIDKGWLYIIPSYIYTTTDQWAAHYTNLLARYSK